MSWTGEYDIVREGGPHFRQMEEDFDRILGEIVGEAVGRQVDKEIMGMTSVGDKKQGFDPELGKAMDRAFEEHSRIVNPMTDDGTLRTFETGATRDTAEDKLDYEGFISPAVMKAFATYMHGHRKQTDGTFRDSDNWQRGMPRNQYVKSLVRHTLDLWWWWRTDSDSTEIIVELLCAIMFNVQGLLYEIIMGREVGE